MEQFQIREMRETDIAQVEAIEQEIFSVPWSEKSFLSACTTPENIYLVCLAGEEVAGTADCGVCLAKGIHQYGSGRKIPQKRSGGSADERNGRTRQTKRRDDIFS